MTTLLGCLAALALAVALFFASAMAVGIWLSVVAVWMGPR